MKKIIITILTVFLMTVLVGCHMVKAEDVVRVKEDTIPTEITGADLDISKIMLDVTFEDGSEALIKLEEKMLVSTTLNDLREPGQHEVRVNYKDAYLSFDLVVLENYPDVNVKFMDKDEVLEEKTIEKHQEFGALPTPEKAGYRFDGWYLEACYRTLVTEQTKADVAVGETELKLYAHFTPITYEVTFNYDGLKIVEKVLYGDAIYFFPTFGLTAEEIDGYFNGTSKVTADTKVTSNITVDLKKK